MWPGPEQAGSICVEYRVGRAYIAVHTKPPGRGACDPHPRRCRGRQKHKRSGSPITFVSGRLFAAPPPARLRGGSTPVPLGGQENATDKYTEDEILTATKGFFGDTSKDLATIIEKVLKDQGEPNAYITGEEAPGAIAVGVRYGNGWMHRKTAGNMRIFWQGPSLGFDLGANASKVFPLVYNIGSSGQSFQRSHGVEGTIYVVGGFGVNYQQRGNVILAPIRTGVGLRAGANIGYLS